MDTNDSLRLASLWHSMHAISQQLSPVPSCSGIELLQADTFDLHCYQSLTGTKFFVVCEPGTLHMEGLLKHIYELYTDFVLKNPFYEMEMPIRCELFDFNLAPAVQKDRVALLGRWALLYVNLDLAIWELVSFVYVDSGCCHGRWILFNFAIFTYQVIFVRRSSIISCILIAKSYEPRSICDLKALRKFNCHGY